MMEFNDNIPWHEVDIDHPSNDFPEHSLWSQADYRYLRNELDSYERASAIPRSQRIGQVAIELLSLLDSSDPSGRDR